MSAQPGHSDSASQLGAGYYLRHNDSLISRPAVSQIRKEAHVVQSALVELVSTKVAMYVMHGNGNVIAVVMLPPEVSESVGSATLARNICNAVRSIRIDGVAYVQCRAATPRFWFFDCDGTYERMCGNGLRCATLLMHDLGLIGVNAVIGTDAGPRTVRIEGGEPVVSVGIPENYQILDSSFFVYTGVPHLVVFSNDLDSIDVLSEGAKLRYDPRICSTAGHPEGVHVNFAEFADSSLHVRTYEVGVEGETMSCSTGVAAVSHVARELGLITLPAKVRTKGGWLTVAVERGELMVSGHTDYIC